MNQLIRNLKKHGWPPKRLAERWGNITTVQVSRIGKNPKKLHIDAANWLMRDVKTMSEKYHENWAENCISELIRIYGPNAKIIAGFIDACVDGTEQKYLNDYVVKG
ncbi:hypothetical protein KAR91_26925 [Candidatus Pacearchaeota archaeon]|nr:hypothetical protein [Candidatus Pacearchaeota archaeon]